MKNCTNCEATLVDEAVVCTECGASQEPVATAAPAAAAAPAVEEKKPSGVLRTGHVVFSMITMLFFNSTCGILGLVMTILAQYAKDAKDEAKKIKIGLSFNIIGVALTVLSLVAVFAYLAIYMFFLIFAIAMSGGAAMM